MDKHRTGFLGQTRNALRALLWGAVGKVTAYVALGNWPDSVHAVIRSVHEHAYFEWSDAARVARVQVCPGCTGPVVDNEVAGLRIVTHRGLAFCSADCVSKFRRDVERSSAAMPS